MLPLGSYGVFLIAESLRMMGFSLVCFGYLIYLYTCKDDLPKNNPYIEPMASKKR
jgi:hypothetical protein